MSTPSIGFIGIGLMGAAMVGRLLDKGYTVTLMANKSRPRVDDAVAAGATEVGTARDVAAAADIVMLCMDTSANVEARMRGADGAMTGFAYPEMLVTLVNLYNAGQAERASDIFDAFLPIIRLEQQPGAGLAIRKEILRRRGAMSCNAPRLPGPKLSALDMDDITRLTSRLERRLQELDVTEFTL